MIIVKKLMAQLVKKSGIYIKLKQQKIIKKYL